MRLTGTTLRIGTALAVIGAAYLPSSANAWGFPIPSLLPDLFQPVVVPPGPRTCPIDRESFFKDYEEQADGSYLYEGDVAVGHHEHVEKKYSEACKNFSLISAPDDFAEIMGAVKLDSGGNRAIWDASQRGQLTYCIQQSSTFNPIAPTQNMSDSQVLRLRQELDSAAKSWEQYADVDFINIGTFGQTCDELETNPSFQEPLFRVEGGARFGFGGIPGVAFFPDSPAAQRRVTISVDCIDNGRCTLGNGTIPLSGLVQHELGHVLGLVHEHIRVSSCDGIAVEGVDYESITTYDQNSVMHYRSSDCNGTGSDRWFITNRDRQTVADLYPASMPQPPMQAPVAAVIQPSKVFDEIPIFLDGSNSSDPNGEQLSYMWNFGDGNTLTTSNEIVSHIYKEPSIYMLSLTVTNASGLTGTFETTVKVDVNPGAMVAVRSLLLSP
ncbi:MAG: PKD domain-containing protein [Pseudomonadota bacterium]